MNEENINLSEQSQENDNEEETNKEQLEDLVKKQFEKVRMAGLLSGSKAICGVILNYIADYYKTPGKQTFRQQEKLIKKIKNFCETGNSCYIDENGEIQKVSKDNSQEAT